MNITNEGHITVFSWEKNDPKGIDFKNLVKGAYKNVSNQNIIIDLSLRAPLFPKNILEFTELSAYHKTVAKKSFVLVVGHLPLEDLQDEIAVTPTLGEAKDLVEMEEIERDLGY